MALVNPKAIWGAPRSVRGWKNRLRGGQLLWLFYVLWKTFPMKWSAIDICQNNFDKVWWRDFFAIVDKDKLDDLSPSPFFLWKREIITMSMLPTERRRERRSRRTSSKERWSFDSNEIIEFHLKNNLSKTRIIIQTIKVYCQ